MTELERYLAEEIAEDHVDGIITRREAMRRLALLGVGATTASAMITAEAHARDRGKNKAHDHGHGHADGRVRAWAPEATGEIEFPGPNGKLRGAWAPAATKVKGGVLVIHENRGLTDHIRNVAGRFAANGFSALALDLLSEEGGTAAVGDDAAVMAKLSEISAGNPARLDNDIKAAGPDIARRVGRGGPPSRRRLCLRGG